MLQELIKFMPMAEKIIPRKTGIEVLRNICAAKGKLKATDLEMTLEMPVKDKRSFLLPLSIVKTLLKTRPKNLSIIKQKDDKIKIEYDDKAITFPATDLSEYPVSTNVEFRKVAAWTKDVFQTIHSQIPYCSNDELRPALCGIYINQNGTMSTCATDGHVLKYVEKIDSKSDVDFISILPKNVFQLLPRFISKEVIVEESEEFVRFVLDNDMNLTVKKVEATYPDFLKVIPNKWSTELRIDRKHLLNLVEAAKGFHASCQFQTKDAAIELSAENPEDNVQWTSKIDMDINHAVNIITCFDLANLEKVLKSIDADSVTWKYNDPNSASVFQGSDNDLNLILPMRLKEEDDNE